MTTMVGLYVEYKAKTQELDQALSRMGREIDQVKSKQNQLQAGFSNMHSNMSNGLNGILGYWKQIVAAIAVYELVAKFNEVAESIDKISKSAGTLGTSVENLQRLKYIGDLAGVSMDDLELSMRKMSLSLGQAMRSSDGTNSAFKSLGINMKAIQGKDTAEQYQMIAEALSKVQDKNLQASLAMEIFGRNYSTVLKMIRQDINSTAKEFDKLGLALTDSQARAVEDFNDAKTRISAIWEGLSTKIVAYIAPAFEKILTFINDTIIKFGGIDSVAQAFGKAVVSAVQWAVEAMNSLLNKIDAIHARMLKIRIFANEINGGQSSIPDPFVLGKALFEKVTGSTTFSESRGESAASLPAMYKQLAELEKGAQTRKDFLKPLTDKIGEEADKIGVLESVIPPIHDLGEATKKTTQQIIAAGNKANDFLSNMIKSAGQEKLQKILGTDQQTGQTNEVTNENWDMLIKEIYNSALSGKAFGDRSNLTGYNELTAQQGLNRLKEQVSDYGRSGDISGIKQYIGAIDELSGFLQKINLQTQKVDLNIEVKTEEGFVLKIAQSAEMQKMAQKEALDIAIKTARQLRGA